MDICFHIRCIWIHLHNSKKCTIARSSSWIRICFAPKWSSHLEKAVSLLPNHDSWDKNCWNYRVVVWGVSEAWRFFSGRLLPAKKKVWCSPGSISSHQVQILLGLYGWPHNIPTDSAHSMLPQGTCSPNAQGGHDQNAWRQLAAKLDTLDSLLLLEESRQTTWNGEYCHL